MIFLGSAGGQTCIFSTHPYVDGMARAKNIHGGGSKTTENGLRFEQETDLLAWLKEVPFLEIAESRVLFEGKHVASVFEKNGFYKKFLNPKGVDADAILSKKLLPDSALVHHQHKKVFIIEKKFQEIAGSVDEKLQTCDFKLKQYQKLLAALDYEAHFIFLLNDWYERKEYKDVLAYIEDVGCSYYFKYLLLESIKLDEPTLRAL